MSADSGWPDILHSVEFFSSVTAVSSVVQEEAAIQQR